ncbi:metallophosphoesterase [Paenibacillus sp. FSL H7-0943]|uniref:metallophosphoesterase family protein n=1 Tax=Paenibacillus sp. FSL H7-0943 TaxID=2954739 RepID=UPI0030D298DA
MITEGPAFDLISDVHLDFYVSNTNANRLEQRINRFVEGILPDDPADTLVIAGDLGHYNVQNVIMLGVLREYYQHIIFVRGNHDLYLISNSQKEMYQNSSQSRWLHMKELAADIPGVYVLEGQTLQLGGIIFGGTGMWYDYSYGIQVLKQKVSWIHEVWRTRMNDINYITDMPDFQQERELLDPILDKSDVIVTHMGPDWSQLPLKHQEDIIQSFYFFDGAAWLPRLHGKTWCFGHYGAYEKEGCTFVNNALGYPYERKKAKIIKVWLNDMCYGAAE